MIYLKGCAILFPIPTPPGWQWQMRRGAEKSFQYRNRSERTVLNRDPLVYLKFSVLKWPDRVNEHYNLQVDCGCRYEGR